MYVLQAGFSLLKRCPISSFSSSMSGLLLENHPFILRLIRVQNRTARTQLTCVHALATALFFRMPHSRKAHTVLCDIAWYGYDKILL